LPSLIVAVIALSFGCSSPTEQEDTFTDDIQTIYLYPDYRVTFNVAVSFTDEDKNKWNAYTAGIFLNSGKDTLKSIAMSFTLMNLARDSVFTENVGYFTLDQAFLRYFPEYPYKKEFNLAPNQEYYFYAASDTMNEELWNITAWLSPIEKIGG